MSIRVFSIVALLVALTAVAAAVPVNDGLIIHLSADSITGLGEGDPVAFWADSATADSVNGSVSSVTGQSLPTYHLHGVNGRPIVRFTDDVLSTASQFALPSPSAGMTIFALFSGDQSGEVAERFAQIGAAAGSGGQVIGLDASVNRTLDNGGCGFRFNNGRALAKSNNPLTTGFHLGAWQMAQGAQHRDAKLYVDSPTPLTLDNINNPANTTTLPAGGNIFSLGNGTLSGSWIAGDYYHGDIAEVLVYNRLLGQSEIAAVQDYLYNRYFTGVLDIDPATLALEEGQAATFSIALKTEPLGQVTVHLQDSSSPAQLMLDTATLVFNQENWDQPRFVQVTAIDDLLFESEVHAGTVLLTLESLDPGYNGAVMAVNVAISDNECGRWAYPPGDFNEDCVVNLFDLAVIARHWLWCDPMKDDSCADLR